MKELHIILHNSIPKYLDIYNQIKDLILSNKLNHNDKLISKRELAKELNCSINSVVNAYNILLDEGYIYSKEKSGYYVNNLNYSKIKPKYSIKE
jgi:GntR family transcriptional regulator/MocR family aminotransferase